MIELDADMPFLSAALDLTTAERELNHACETLAPLRLQSANVVRHKPSRRCLIEYVVESKNGLLNVFGKARAKGVDDRTFRLVQRLREAGFGDDAIDEIVVPEPLGVVPAFHMWLQRKMPGQLPTGSVGDMHRVAESLQKLHKSAIPTGRRHDLADELTILDSSLSRLARERPEWAGRLRSVLDKCHRLATSIARTKPCGIHRDFYADQLLIDGSRVYLLDLDLYCLGDPMLDVGNFAGHLIDESVRRGHADDLEVAVATFVESYSELSGMDCHADVEGYITLTLSRLIAISHRLPGRRPWTESLLDLCERRLDKLTRAPMTLIAV